MKTRGVAAGLAIAGLALALAGCGHTARLATHESHGGAPDLAAQCFSAVQLANEQQNVESAASPTGDGNQWGKLRGTENVEAIRSFRQRTAGLTAASLRDAVAAINADLDRMLKATNGGTYLRYQAASQHLQTDVNALVEGPCKAALN